MARRRWRARAARFVVRLGVLASCACGGSNGGAGDGVVVRQVLRGADALTQGAAPQGQGQGQAAAAPSALSQAVAPSGSTLVADTNYAVYRRALEAARRNEADLSPRARLGVIETQIDQQQEDEP